MGKTEEDIIFFAFRYALGRRTAAVSIVTEHLRNNWPDLSDFTQGQIHEEIYDAIKKKEAGDNCDIKSWKEVLDFKISSLEE